MISVRLARLLNFKVAIPILPHVAVTATVNVNVTTTLSNFLEHLGPRTGLPCALFAQIRF